MRGRRACSYCIAAICFLILISIIIIVIIPLLQSDDPGLPQYSVSDAVLSPNTTAVNDQNLLTTDFRFTLKSYNPSKKKTFFYDIAGANDSSSQVNVSCRVSRFNHTVIASSELSSALVGGGGGPSALPPRNTTGITLNIPVQNVALPLDNNNGTTVYDLILTVTFRAGFVEKESEYRPVVVTCYLSCSFPTGFIFTPGNDRDCATYWANPSY